jgi:CRISPR-associated protein Cas1
MSPLLIGLCTERSVFVSFLTEYGRFLGRVEGPISGNVLLRCEQYRKAEDVQAALRIVRPIVIGKIANCRTVLIRALRDRPDCDGADKLRAACLSLAQDLEALRCSEDIGQIRGIEGQAANTYFSVFDYLITCQKEHFFLKQRTRRPPMDPTNALLSFLYTLLVNDCMDALQAVGLDPAIGFLHSVRPGRPSLALDLMEELRPYLADRLTLSLINRQQVTSDDFVRQESGAVLIDDKARKVVITAWQERKLEQITHPFIQEKIEIGLLPYVQSLLLARHLRGDLDGYPQFVWK